MKKYNCLSCGIEKVFDGRNKNKYCSAKCQMDFQYEETVRKWKETGTFSRVGTPAWLKKYLLDKQDDKCLKCGIKDWCNEPIVFELEHIDGNSTNNVEDNVCLLCPNCHSQTPTFKGANRGNGRHARRERYKEGKSF